MKQWLLIFFHAAALSLSACGSSQKIDGRSAEKFESSVTKALIASSDEDREYYSDAITHYVRSSNLIDTNPIIRSKLHGKTLREIRLLMVSEEIARLEKSMRLMKARISTLEENIEESRGDAENEKSTREKALAKKLERTQRLEEAAKLLTINCIRSPNSFSPLVFEISNSSGEGFSIRNIQITYLEQGVRKSIDDYMLKGAEEISANSRVRLEHAYFVSEACHSWSKLKLEISDPFSYSDFSDITRSFLTTALKQKENELANLNAQLTTLENEKAGWQAEYVYRSTPH